MKNLFISTIVAFQVVNSANYYHQEFFGLDEDGFPCSGSEDGYEFVEKCFLNPSESVPHGAERWPLLSSNHEENGHELQRPRQNLEDISFVPGGFASSPKDDKKTMQEDKTNYPKFPFDSYKLPDLSLFASRKPDLRNSSAEITVPSVKCMRFITPIEPPSLQPTQNLPLKRVRVRVDGEDEKVSKRPKNSETMSAPSVSNLSNISHRPTPKNGDGATAYNTVPPALVSLFNTLTGKDFSPKAVYQSIILFFLAKSNNIAIPNLPSHYSVIKISSLHSHLREAARQYRLQRGLFPYELPIDEFETFLSQVVTDNVCFLKSIDSTDELVRCLQERLDVARQRPYKLDEDGANELLFNSLRNNGFAPRNADNARAIALRLLTGGKYTEDLATIYELGKEVKKHSGICSSHRLRFYDAVTYFVQFSKFPMQST
jgi:hypothetical protein